MSETPVISFITPCFNRRDFLVRCINSIPAEFRSQVEHIIVDGGSTDGSVELVRNYPHVRLLSEPDQGLYDAANKGIRLAHGKYIGFLATDDFIANKFFEYFFGGTDGLVQGADVISFNFVNHVGEGSRSVLAAPFGFEAIFHGRAPLFSLLIRRDILNRLAGFDVSYRIAGDFELALRLASLKLNSTSMPYVMQNFWMHEGSLTGHSGLARDREYREVVRVVAGKLPSLAVRQGFFPLARERIADVARFHYRKGNFRALLSDWRLVAMILLMGVDFR